MLNGKIEHFSNGFEISWEENTISNVPQINQKRFFIAKSGILEWNLMKPTQEGGNDRINWLMTYGKSYDSHIGVVNKGVDNGQETTFETNTDFYEWVLDRIK